MYSAFKDTLKGFLAFGVSSSLVSAIGFILIPVYTSHLSVSEFGLLGLIGLSVSVLTAIFGLGLNSAIFRSYFDYNDPLDQKKLVGTALIVASTAAASLVLLATVIAEPIIAERVFHVPDTGGYFRLALYTGAIGLLNTIPLAVYRAQRRFSRFAWFNVVTAVVQVFLIIWLVVYLHYELWGILFGQFIAAVTVNALLLFSIHSNIELRILKGEVKKLLAYGMPLVPGGVFYILLTAGGIYFVQVTQGLTEAGIVNLAIKIASVFVILVVSPFQLIWSPMMFSVEKTEYAERFYSNILIYALYVSVVLAAALSVFAPEIIDTVATPEYESASHIVWLLLLGQVVFVIQNVFNAGIILKRKTAYWSVALVVETIVCILFWLLLSPRWGAVGVAVGSVIGYTVGAGLTLMFSRRFLSLHYEWGRVLFLLLLFFVALGISYMLPASIGSYIFVSKALLIVFISACPFLVRFWHPDELVAGKQLVNQVIRRIPWQFSTASK